MDIESAFANASGKTRDSCDGRLVLPIDRRGGTVWSVGPADLVIEPKGAPRLQTEKLFQNGPEWCEPSRK